MSYRNILQRIMQNAANPNVRESSFSNECPPLVSDYINPSIKIFKRSTRHSQEAYSRTLNINKSKTARHQNSFLPSMLRLWNQLSEETCLIWWLATMVLLNVGLMLDSPFVNYCRNYHTCTRPGMAVAIAQEVAKYLEIDLEFTLMNYSAYGAFENGTWSGMLGDIHAGRFDTSQPMFTPTPTRSDYFDFSENVFNLENAFLFRKPPVRNISITALLFPFDWLICLLITLSFFTVGSAITWYEMVLPPVRHISKEHVTDGVKTWFSTVVATLGLALNQGPDGVNVVKAATHILIGVWALTTVVLVALYSGELLSSLLSAPLALPFKDLDTFAQCVDSGQCIVHVPSLSVSRFETIATDTTEQFTMIRNAITKHPVIENSNVSVVKEWIYATPPPTFNVYWALQFVMISAVSENCSFMIQNDNLMIERGMFPFKKGSNWTAKFSNAFVQLAEIGIYNRIIKKYVPTRLCGESGGAQVTHHRPFPLRSIYGPLMILMSGGMMGALSLLCECCAGYNIKRKVLTLLGHQEASLGSQL